MSDELRDRYGTASPRRRSVLIVATTVLALVFLGWIGWVVWFHSNPAIQVEVTSFDLGDAHHARFQVASRFRDQGVDGSCLFRATARDHTIVGEVNLTVAQLRAAGNDWIPMTTLSEATTVEKIRCSER